MGILTLVYAGQVSRPHVFDMRKVEHPLMTAVLFGAIGPAWLFAALESRADKGG